MGDAEFLSAGYCIDAGQISHEGLEVVSRLILFSLLDGHDICILLSIW